MSPLSIFTSINPTDKEKPFKITKQYIKLFFSKVSCKESSQNVLLNNLMPNNHTTQANFFSFLFFLMRNRFRRAKVLKNTFPVLLLACSALTLPLKVFTIWFLRHSVVCLVLLSKEGRKAVNSGLMTHSTQILRRTHARPLVSFLTWVQAVPLL